MPKSWGFLLPSVSINQPHGAAVSHTIFSREHQNYFVGGEERIFSHLESILV